VTNVLVDFGLSEETLAVVFVPAPWVSASHTLTPTPSVLQPSSHDTEDVLAEELKYVCADVSPGVGFNLYVSAPNGTWGQYYFDVVGS
jgi:hypothetical protein